MARDRIEELLGQEIGLEPASIGAKTLARAVRRRIKATGDADEAHYLRRIQGSRRELQELIEEVVVRNSWFFREPASFALLRRCLDEGIPPAPGPGPALRFLSLGCAGGEEPYSILITLAGLPHPPTDYSVDAVDVSQRALDIAARARYRPASFFGQDLAFRQRHFVPEGGEHVLRREIADRVTWIQGNVIDPTLARKLSIYNVVFCRNLLIYFTEAGQRRAVALIRKLLAPGGYLFVGCVDRGKVAGHGFEPIAFPGAFAFRRLEDEAVPRTPVARGTFLIPALDTPKPVAAAQPPAAPPLKRSETVLVELPAAPDAASAAPRRSQSLTDGPIKPVKSRPDRLLNCETQLIRLEWLEGAGEADLPCWKREGIFGEACCLHLDQLDSCYYCPIYCNQGRALFERPIPPDYRADWTDLLRQPRRDQTTALSSALIFRLWDQRFALAAARVFAVALPAQVHSIPNRTGRVFRGLMNITGCVRLCFSLHELLELIPLEEGSVPGTRSASQKRMVVIGQDEETWAFWADEVYGVHRYRDDASGGAVHRGAPAATVRTTASFIRGSFSREAQRVALLDEDLLLAGLRRVIQ